MPTSADPRNRLVIRCADPRTDSILVLSVPTPIGRLRLAAASCGLLRIELPGSDAEANMSAWLSSHFRKAKTRRGVNPILRKAASQIEAYFTGRLGGFSLQVDVAGTPFQVAVWRAVAEIPFGRTSSYAQVASVVGREKAVRAVGSAQGANPLPIVIPCHRVIGADGTLTGYGGGLAVKRWLLDHESQIVALHASPTQGPSPGHEAVRSLPARTPSPPVPPRS